jgi:hypothetical protein
MKPGVAQPKRKWVGGLSLHIFDVGHVSKETQKSKMLIKTIW